MLSGNSQTVGDTSFANLSNIEALDFTGSSNSITLDSERINDWLGASGIFNISGSGDDTLNITTNNADYRWSNDGGSSWSNTNITDIATGTYLFDTNNDNTSNFTLQVV
jgi:hypothetical protein